MLNYEEMSDFEINMRVACSIDGVRVDENGNPEYAIDCFLHSDNGISVKWLRCGNDEFEFFNPCNNPSDAMPILIEMKIGFKWVNGSCTASSALRGYHESTSDKPLRAAMIVFLMMPHK